jgi:hypothetical protein
MTAGLIGPGVAYAADTVDPLSATEMAAALKQVDTATAVVAQPGWRAAETVGGLLSAAGVFVLDRRGGRVFDQFRVGRDVLTSYAAEHRGTYENVTDPASRSALRMMHRSGVRYVFTPDKRLALDHYVTENGPAPSVVLTEDVKHAGTRTTHDDGSADYRYTDQDGAVVTIAVSAAGVLTSAHAAMSGLTVAVSFTYGPQHVTLPAASATIGSAALARGVAYLDMSANVKAVAHDGAAAARRSAHGHAVRTSALRTAVRRAAARFNATVEGTVVRVRNIHGGARVYATNPWTHKTVTYTVKASGRKVVVRRK